MTERELIDYFNEHVLYEWLMLRYSMARLESCNDQLLWNALFAAFNVSARNISDFFSAGDSRTVSYRDFDGHYGSFSCTSMSDIHGTLNKLNSHCMHLGKQRKMVRDKKVTLERLRSVFEWADENMVRFVASVDFKVYADRADLAKQTQPSVLTLHQPLKSSATNLPGVIMTTALGKSIQLFEAPSQPERCDAKDKQK